MTILEIINNFVNSWYFVVIILGSLFLLLTRKVLNDKLKKLSFKFNNKKLDIRERQENSNIRDPENKEYKKVKELFKKLNVKNFEQMNQLFEQKEQGIKDSETHRSALFQLWKQYMFLFFNLFLVPRSKLALIWLYNNPNSTREMLILNINLPQDFENKELEREAVFNALVSHSLIHKVDNDLYQITNIGIDFLKFIQLVK